MRSPEIEPARLERLLAGFAPETAQEAILQGLVRELRGGMPEASLALRERVRALTMPEPRRRPEVTRRRIAVVALAAAALAAVGAFAVLGRDSGSDTTAAPSRELSAQLSAPTTTVAGGSGDMPASEAESGELRAQAAVPDVLQRDSALTLSAETLNKDSASAAGFAPIGGARAVDVDMLLELRVAGADELSAATNEAMRTAKKLGGHVRSSNVDTQGNEGRTALELSIPVGRLEDAVVQLSALGTITKQQVATQDLQGGVDRRSKRIATLGRAIAADKLRLESGALTAYEELQVELRLMRERAELTRVRRERSAILREASMAEVTLALHTREAAAGAKDDDEGKLVGALRDGVDYLVAGGAVAIVILIVASPLIVLGIVAWLLLRTRRRRIDDRLLAEPRPAGPPHPSE
jgi:hypothetical protein